MKHSIIFCMLIFVCLSASADNTRTIIIKTGQTMTVYNVTDYGESNFWGRNIIIEKRDVALPSDNYYETLNIPKKEWECFSQSNNGVYDTQAASIQKERNELQRTYNQLFAKSTKQEKLINILETSLAASLFIILFLILKMTRGSLQKELKDDIISKVH